MLLTYIIISILFGSIGSIFLSGTLLLFDENRLHSATGYLVSMAGGTLLGAAFLGMMPKAVDLSDTGKVFSVTLVGIVVFFIIEKVVLWHSCYRKDCKRRQNASAELILVGDAFHNFIDGIVITSAFFSSITFGLLVTLTVFLHEVPQELADFSILIKNGYSRTKAMICNTLSGVTALLGGIFAYFAMNKIESLIPYFLSLSAASFIYIALADLVPQMHNNTKIKDSIIQISLIVTGILIIFFIKQL